MLDGGASRSTVVNGILSSTEYRQKVIQGYYSSYLGRAADQAGMNSMLNYLNMGGTFQGVQAAILGSDEYYQRAGGTTTGFLSTLYQSVLGRTIDPYGLSSFTQLLVTGTSRFTVASVVLSSIEADTLWVQGMYRQILGREGGAAEIGNWVSTAINGMPQNLIQEILPDVIRVHLPAVRGTGIPWGKGGTSVPHLPHFFPAPLR